MLNVPPRQVNVIAQLDGQAVNVIDHAMKNSMVLHVVYNVTASITVLVIHKMVCILRS